MAYCGNGPGKSAGRVVDDSRNKVTVKPGQVVAGGPLDEWEERLDVVEDLCKVLDDAEVGGGIPMVLTAWP